MTVVGLEKSHKLKLSENYQHGYSFYILIVHPDGLLSL